MPKITEATGRCLCGGVGFTAKNMSQPIGEKPAFYSFANKTKILTGAEVSGQYGTSAKE